MRKQKGFSLIELLIVVAIILIIAAIAIPNLLRSRMAANEASAVGSVRTINTAEVTYATTYPTTGFSVDLLSLGGTAAKCQAGSTTISTSQACIIDPTLSTGTKTGYSLKAAGSIGTGSTIYTSYLVTAVPATVGTTGTRGFCSTEAGVIYFITGATVGTPAADAATCTGATFAPLQ